MNILRHLFPSATDADRAATVDHVLVPSPTEDWRDRAVCEAARKYGRPFRCGPDHLPHETYVAPGVLATTLQEKRQ